MSKQEQFRFYDIMNCYLDDERLAAFAIIELGNVQLEPIEVYSDLIACRYKKWLDKLELIAEETKCKVLKEWCLQKQFDLDMSNSLIWAIDDLKMVELHGWRTVDSLRKEDQRKGLK